MRQLSKRTQYSLRALYALTRTYGAGPQLITNLAHDETIPKKFLEQILVALKSGGFVASKKGKGRRLCAGAIARQDHDRRGHSGYRRAAGTAAVRERNTLSQVR